MIPPDPQSASSPFDPDAPPPRDAAPPTSGRVLLAVAAALVLAALMVVGVSATLLAYGGGKTLTPGVQGAVFVLAASVLGAVFVAWALNPAGRRALRPPPRLPIDGPVPADAAQRELFYFERMERYRSELARRDVLLHRQRASRDRFVLHSALLVAAVLTALIHQATGAAAAKVVALAFPAGLAGQAVPWYLDKLQTLLLIPFAAVAAGLAVAYDAQAASCPPRLRRAAFIGGGGTLLAGLLFVFQVSPELLGLMRNSGYRVHVGDAVVPFDLWLLGQRLVLIPAVGVLAGILCRRLVCRVPEDE